MTIQNLKKMLTANKVSNSLIIFITGKKNSKAKQFLAEQYINAIVESKSRSLIYVDSLESTTSSSIFDTEDTVDVANFRVYYTDKFVVTNVDQLMEEKLFIITKEATLDKSLDKMAEEILSAQSVIIPDFEPWQVYDYMLSRAEGLDIEIAKWLYQLYEGDIYRIDSELDKLSAFSPPNQRSLVEEFQREGIFESVPQTTVFECINGLLSKNINKVMLLYKYRDNFFQVKGSEFGFLTLVVQNLRNMLLVKTSANPTEETTGLSSKQIWALKNQPIAFSTNACVQIFDMLSDIDKRIKSGELDATYAIDYIILKIMSM